MGCPRIAGLTSSEELGTMSKNNLTGITLGIWPIPRIHFLTLIISWQRLIAITLGWSVAIVSSQPFSLGPSSHAMFDYPKSSQPFCSITKIAITGTNIFFFHIQF